MKRSLPIGCTMVPGSHWPFLFTVTCVPGDRSFGPKDAAADSSTGAGVVEGVQAAPRAAARTKAAPEVARAKRWCRIMAPDDSGARDAVGTKSHLPGVAVVI